MMYLFSDEFASRIYRAILSHICNIIFTLLTFAENWYFWYFWYFFKFTMYVYMSVHSSFQKRAFCLFETELRYLDVCKNVGAAFVINHAGIGKTKGKKLRCMYMRKYLVLRVVSARRALSRYSYTHMKQYFWQK
jgi:hypothetical protein